MSDENNNGRKPLTLKPRTGGSVSSGTVKQSFSHGRTKTVVVETKRARPHAPAGGNLAAPSAAERRVFEPPRPAAPQGQRPSAPADGLSPEERAARQRVIEAARARQAQEEAERRAREERARAEEAAR
ncbi:MAG: IF-2-associated domain-containing protein, partial [Pseudomonadota bacterium]